MALAERAELVARLSLKDDFSGPLGRAESRMRGLSRTASAVGRDVGHGVRNTARNLERLAFAGAALAAGGGLAAVKWAGDFQAGMQTINTVALATPEALGKAGEGIRNLFRETGQSMEDLQAAEYDLVSAGIKLQDAQAGVTQAVRLGIGALGSTAQAVDVLTTAVNSYNLKAKDGTVATATWTRISDELAQAVADGKVKLDEIAASYAQVAPVAAQAGVRTGEIAAALGYLTAKGNPAAETLTQMNRAIIELSKPKGDMLKVLDKLGTTGTELIKKNGLGGALEIIRQQAAKMKIPFVELFGRVEAYKFALQTTGPNAAGFAAELDRIAHSAGMTNKQFDERAQGLNYQMGVLKANVQDAGITIGSALLPKITEMATKVADFLRSHQQEIKNFGDNLAAGFSKAADYAMSIDWSAIGNAIKGLASFGKGLAEAFMSMPPEAKQLLLGLYGLNKLSGGAVVNVSVDLLKGVAGRFFARGSSPANPMFVATAGGLGGGVAGTARTGLSTLGKVFLIGEAIGLVAAVADVAVAVRDENLQQAKDIHTVLDQSLAGPQTVAELNQKLAGIDQGLRNLGVDPFSKDIPLLSQLVAGPTIDELVRMRTEVVAALAARLDAKPGSPDERRDLRSIAHHIAALNNRHARLLANQQPSDDKPHKDSAATQAKLETQRKLLASLDSRTEDVKTHTDILKTAAVSKVGDLQRTTSSGSSSIVSAIERNKPVVNVSVSVVGSRVTVTSDTGGSLNRESPKPTGPGHGM